MPEFRYRLQSLLGVRRLECEQRQVALSEATAVEQSLQNERAAIERELAAQQSSTRAGTGPGLLDVESLAAVQRYVTGLRGRLGALTERERAMSAETEIRRQALLESDREVRVLEKLRDRQHEQFRNYATRVETRELDDFAGRTVNRPPAE